MKPERIRGVEMHYYAVCHRKLWLFHHGIGFEQDGNERIVAGKLLHDQAYPRMEKELAPDEAIRVDRQDGDVLREVKLTSKMEMADRLQMLYYLYVYKNQGLHKTGLLSYPKERKTVEVILDAAGEKRVEEALANIQSILNEAIPAFRKMSYCGKCAYNDFCYAGEVDEDGA